MFYILPAMSLLSYLAKPAPPPNFSDSENTFPTKLVERIDTHIEQRFEGVPLTGIVVALDDGQHQVFIKVYGDTEIGALKPMQLDTGFRIAFISKTFTAAVVMKLDEEKKIDLDNVIIVILMNTAPSITNDELV